MITGFRVRVAVEIVRDSIDFDPTLGKIAVDTGRVILVGLLGCCCDILDVLESAWKIGVVKGI